MSERSSRISRLLRSQESRASYIKAKLSVLVPAQIRALRLKSTTPPMPFQRDLAEEAEVHQSRISMFETPGANITLETLSKIAAALRCGVVIKFVPFSEMLRWENSFSADTFEVLRLEQDKAFLNPESIASNKNMQLNSIGSSKSDSNSLAGASAERDETIHSHQLSLSEISFGELPTTVNNVYGELRA
jgi:transcriptional regulator with XRE-family HTH domain